MTITPMFPLGSVLLPGGALPLHVFEPRYQQLVTDCLNSDSAPQFGQVLIARGREVGGGDTRHGVGVLAEIVAHVEVGQGQHALDCRGRERIRILNWLDDDPYPRAEIELWPDTNDGPVEPGFHNFAARIAELYGLLEQLAGRQDMPVPELPTLGGVSETPALHLYQLADCLPLGEVDRYRMLSAPGVKERAEVLSDALEGLIEVAEFGLID
ncbi:LON peptidase substrate-binding domain-containing protein [Hoyosella rhizosphaerae]|uniref:ATP-dependent protease n=1 Tax=Hoyosella rhizosphaerae TaxID=1755582 RepID=A0A916U8L2_9ACTN|nr:LON peptidase substrate-binding domain-containing protein [Hoyosella rhizosphaerae]MBN4927564.1 LON peptidase substrate-binding domain-containing protein [Hoyosella rhizosphaerae]GGC63467.1 ATP-dependent protease [Hoyosella rhizosphaerae]